MSTVKTLSWLEVGYIDRIGLVTTWTSGLCNTWWNGVPLRHAYLCTAEPAVLMQLLQVLQQAEVHNIVTPLYKRLWLQLDIMVQLNVGFKVSC